MRQALFAVVLVGASFAGGAAVNGPGLRWAQAWALGRLGLVQEHAPGTPAPVAPDPDGDQPPGDRGIAPLALNAPDTPAGSSSASGSTPATTSTKTPDGPIAPEPGARGASKAPQAAGAAPVALDATDLPALERPAPLSAAGETEPAPSDPSPATETAKSPETSGSTDATKKAGRGFGDMTVALASMAGKALAGAGEGGSNAAPPADETKPGAGASAPASGSSSTVPGEPTDWAGVRRALKLLGVSRYGIEAEPTGRARFHCVIPLAGRRAVGQHFEAEGDDELDAARAALRRIALWRASEETAAGAGAGR